MDGVFMTLGSGPRRRLPLLLGDRASDKYVKSVIRIREQRGCGETGEAAAAAADGQGGNES